MEQNYLVYSAQGFWGPGVWTSDLKDAKRFDRDTALTFCRKRYSPLGATSIAVPVLEADVIAVLSK